MAGRGAVHGARQRGNSGPRAQLAETTKKVRATANLPVDLYEKLALATESSGMTISSYLCALVERDLDTSHQPGAAAA